MILKNYLLNLMVEEKEIIEELLNIDNKICHTNLTYEALIKSFAHETKIGPLINNQCDFITDGNPYTTFFILINYSEFINKININGRFIGINKWLVEKSKTYYQITLDVKKNYVDYINSDKIVIVGFKEFIFGINDMFEDKDILLIEI